MADDNDATDVFVYMGEGVVVPRDVVRVRIDPSVLVIPEHAFFQRYKLETVEFHDGLLEIGQQAFQFCMALSEARLSMESRVLELTHLSVVTSLNSEVRHSLPQSPAACSTVVHEYFPWRYQKLSFR